MDTNDPALWTATQTVQKVTSQEISPQKVVEACLQRIEKYNPEINAICTLADDALEQAEQVEKEIREGIKKPLHGVTVGVKDVTPTKNLKTTYGCKLYEDNVPEEDALCVKRLRDAGAIIIGKTNTPEFAAGGHTFNEVFGTTYNPWNKSRSAGGSTGGGAAALAAGMIHIAEGTDLGGSLRIPASFCGIVGIRSSPGLVPNWPWAYGWDQLSIAGPMARCVEDLALALQAMSGPSEYSPISQPFNNRDFTKAVGSFIEGAKIAYTPDIAGIGIESQVESVCRSSALEKASAFAQVSEIEMNLAFAWETFLHLRGHWMLSMHHHHIPQKESFGANLRGNIEAGLAGTTENLGKAERIRTELWHKFRVFFQEYDYLVTPCMAISPFPADQSYPKNIAGREMKTYVDWIAPTFLLSMTSLPVACVPCGLDEMGMPVGMQIVGKPRNEEGVLALAKKIEEVCSIGLPDLNKTLK